MTFEVVTDQFCCLFSPQSAVAKYASQFRGNSQQDALEFLLWLLDRVHEDADQSINSSTNSSSKTKASSKVSPQTVGSFHRTIKVSLNHQSTFTVIVWIADSRPSCLHYIHTFKGVQFHPSCLSLRTFCSFASLVIEDGGEEALRVKTASLRSSRRSIMVFSNNVVKSTVWRLFHLYCFYLGGTEHIMNGSWT